jgi:hypothetical protein
MSEPSDMSSQPSRPSSSEGWQRITAFGIFALLAAILTIKTGSTQELVDVAPYLVMVMSPPAVRGPERTDE